LSGFRCVISLPQGTLFIKDLSLCRQSHRPTGTRKELDAELLLQLRQRLADCRLRDVEKTRRLAKPLPLGHGDKVT